MAHNHEGHDHEGHDHEHEHDHDHDNEHKEGEMPELENQGENKNFNRGEKKCRKALLKLGMKQLTGITRVALRKREGPIYVINNPEVLQSPEFAQSFAIFGELKYEDGNSRLSQTEAKKFTDKPASVAKPVVKDETQVEDDGVPLPEDGLTAENINMVMHHANCSRNNAIKALRETNDDMVNAVMKLTK